MKHLEIIVDTLHIASYKLIGTYILYPMYSYNTLISYLYVAVSNFN